MNISTLFYTTNYLFLKDLLTTCLSIKILKVFEAALNIDKRAFIQHFTPIFILAVFGTLLSTLLTAFFVYYGTYMLQSWCAQIPLHLGYDVLKIGCDRSIILNKQSRISTNCIIFIVIKLAKYSTTRCQTTF